MNTIILIRTIILMTTLMIIIHITLIRMTIITCPNRSR